MIKYLYCYQINKQMDSKDTTDILDKDYLQKLVEVCLNVLLIS